MKKNWIFFKSIFLFVFLLVQSIGTVSAQGLPRSTVKANLVSPQSLLNPDGTLRLDATSSGSLDLSGWDVRADPRLGPVFSPRQQDISPIKLKFSGWFAMGDNGAGNGAISDIVDAIAVDGTNVYVGGNFTDINNHGVVLGAADYIARWDGSNWSALGSNGAGDGSLNRSVDALAVSGGQVYAAGEFTDVNNNGTILPAADYVAKWDGSNWSALGSNGAGDGSLNDWAWAMAVSGNNVYVGGGFTDVNNKGTILTAADYIAKWDGNNWSALGSNGAGNGSLNTYVDAIAVNGSKVYAGGRFSNVNNKGTVLTAADYIAKWDGSNWSALGNNGAGNGSISPSDPDLGVVMAIAISGNTVYVGGQFTNVNNEGTVLTAADYVAKWDGSNWSALGNNGAGNGSLNFRVRAISISAGNVFVGGSFYNVNNHGTVLGAADYVARWDGTNWSALGHGSAVSDGAIPYDPAVEIYALALAGGPSFGVYVGGTTIANINNSGTVLTAADTVAEYMYPGWIYSSIGANDGWVRESSAGSGVGGSLNASNDSIELGDDGQNRQFRSILHFNTSILSTLLPPGAKIINARLRIKQSGLIGSNPFATLQNITIDIVKGAFAGSGVLQKTDFQAAASLNGVGTFTNAPLPGGWYSATLSPSAYVYINLTGVTEFRLEFQTGTNNNAAADYLSFYSGDSATVAYRPTLSITYVVP